MLTGQLAAPLGLNTYCWSAMVGFRSNGQVRLCAASVVAKPAVSGSQERFFSLFASPHQPLLPPFSRLWTLPVSDTTFSCSSAPL